MSPDEIASMIDTMQRFGGRVTYRDLDGVEEKPYEINIALIDALAGPTQNGPDELQYERFVCAHTIMLALEGIPAFYIHSMLATHNDFGRLEHTGRLRSINRHQWHIDELGEALSDHHSIHTKVFDELRRRLNIRRHNPAFHPNATQYTLHLGTAIFGFWRQSFHRDQSIFALHNITDRVQAGALSELNLIDTDTWVDLIANDTIRNLQGELRLEPYRSAWLTNYRGNE